MSPEDVRREAAAWVYVPDDARTDDRAEFLVVAYPPHFSTPTIATRWAPGFADVDAVLASARGLGRDEVHFYEVTPGGALEEELLARGADLYETLAVLALDLTEGVPDLAVPADVTVTGVGSLEDMRAAHRIGRAAFGGVERDDADLEAGHWETYRLARRAGVVVGVAGRTLAPPTVRLWGAAVDPRARRTGAYRALLEARLRDGVEAGCTVALVKGRVETSAPVLTKAGFAAYGEVRAYRLAT